MIISYHRIRDEPKCCTPKKFEEQVQLAKQIGAKLTFDDGLKEHYTVALPILKKYRMKGTFFVITNSQNEMTTTHKLWLLLQDHKKELFKNSKISTRKIPNLNSGYYKTDSIKLRNLKHYYTKHPLQVNKLFKEYYDEDKEIMKMYMTNFEIMKLQYSDMEIGSHSHTHPILSELSKTKQEQEIKTSTKIINDHFDSPIGFSYPHGQYNKTTQLLLKKYNYKYAVSTETDNLFSLRRIDSNEFS